MHWLDIGILIVLGIGAVLGFWSGLLWQVARVVSLVLSLYLAISSNNVVTDWLVRQWQDTSPALCRIAAFVLVFLAVYLALYLTTRIIHKAIKASKLELVDRMLGALLGMAKMGAIVSVVCTGLQTFALPFTQGWMDQSTLAPQFAQGTDMVIGLIPAAYRERVDDNFQQARDQVKKKMADVALDAIKGNAAKAIEP